MIRIAILYVVTALILCVAGAARGAEVDPEGRIILTPRERAECTAAPGGCIITPRWYLEALEEAARQLGQCQAPKPKGRLPKKDET